jgi:hypothetical protein
MPTGPLPSDPSATPSTSSLDRDHRVASGGNRTGLEWGERLPTQRRLTTETLHLTVPASLLGRADELIEMTTLFVALHESSDGTNLPFNAEAP